MTAPENGRGFFERMMKNFLTALACLFLLTPAFAKTVTLYHTSDTHGFFYPKNGRGGAAALAAVLEKEKNPYLLLDSGDFAEGTVETQRSRGLKAVQLMNRLGYDAATVGNHEFAFRDEGFASLAKEAQFPLLAANLTQVASGNYPPGVLPYKIFQINGVKVAVIGLANMRPTNTTRQYTLSKPFPSLKKALQEIAPQHPQVVVVLAHDSLGDDRPGHPFYIGEIGRQLSGSVDVVLGGHAHLIFQNEYRGGVLFAESGCNFQNVTKITLQTDDKTGELLSAKSELIPLEIARTGENPKIKKYAESLREKDVDEPIGQTSAALEKYPQTPGHMDSSVDNWVADATCRYAPADVCIHNTGGARAGLPKGDITRRDIVDLYPFNNTVVKANVSGAFLKKLVKENLTPWNRLAYAGLSVTYHKTKNGKIKNLKIWVRGQQLQEDKQYTVSVNSYVADGGSEGKLFKTLPADALHPAGARMVRQVLEDDFKNGTLVPPPSGRIIEK